MNDGFSFFNQADLTHRLTHALVKRNQEVVFLVGSALSAPTHVGGPGIPNCEGVVASIRQEFEQNPSHLADFLRATASAGARKYQAAFLFLQARLGQSIANEIVRKSVLAARISAPGDVGSDETVGFAHDEDLRTLELDSQWMLGPGTRNLGKLVANYPARFGRSLLTTNFDPLIEVAIRQAGGQYLKTILHADGNLYQTEGPGCQVIHLHGYWFGSDTLHTARQLQQPRPRLRAALTSILRNKLVVVCGYGGWDDVFTEALVEVTREDSASPEILWTFYPATPNIGDDLAKRLEAGLSRGRVSLYAGVDCNVFFPVLYDEWRKLESEAPKPKVGPTNAVRVKESVRREIEKKNPQNRLLEGDDEDRPPVVEVCVGREIELKQIQESDAKVVFLTGIGGQGKSTLAAQYFGMCQSDHSYNYFVWRDCKEESERFENQLTSVIETLSGGAISGADLANQDPESIVRLFLAVIGHLHVLLVFDNVDHYVNLEQGRMTATPNLLIQSVLASRSKIRIILTCRPSVNYNQTFGLSLDLAGISLEAARRLFSERGAVCSEEEIREAHELTNAHAFWLDLLSIQVAKNPSAGLTQLIEKIRSGSGQLPENTLNSIWTTLVERERIVLRSMAETVRPETENEIYSYLQNKLNFHKVIKALNALRSRNLIVVKKRPGVNDLLELHPLVRHFIRKSFSQVDRSSFIDAIIRVYARFIGNNRAALQERPPLSTLQYWTQTVELDIAAGKLKDAFATITEVANAFATSGYPREFSRTVRLLLGSFDWISEHGKYKSFDDIFKLHVTSLSHLGETIEIDELLDRFAMTVPDKDARYILYCDLKCFCKWERGQFIDAVKWGEIGQRLKSSSNVDTRFDVSHNLALSQRDAGHPEAALPVFLRGRSLEEVIDPEEFDEKQMGEQYGNIGRCLQFMGQFDSAIVCYQKSAILIERDPRSEYLMNQGFIRRWIAEGLIARNENKLAGIFLEAARLKWEQVAPPRAAQIALLQVKMQNTVPYPVTLSGHEVERVCRDWIGGRYMDAAIV